MSITQEIPMTCPVCGWGSLNLSLHVHNQHGDPDVVLAMKERERQPICRLCRRGDHGKCVGIACLCVKTKRCRVNAGLVKERVPFGDGGAG